MYYLSDHVLRKYTLNINIRFTMVNLEYAWHIKRFLQAPMHLDCLFLSCPFFIFCHNQSLQICCVREAGRRTVQAGRQVGSAGRQGSRLSKSYLDTDLIADPVFKGQSLGIWGCFKQACFAARKYFQETELPAINLFGKLKSNWMTL